MRFVRQRPFLSALVALVIGTLFYVSINLALLQYELRHAARLYERKQYAAAAAGFKRFLRGDPNHADAHYWCGNALGLSGDVAGAIPELRRAVELEPRNGEYLSSLAVALTENGQDAEAIPVYRSAIALSPRDAELHARLAARYLATGVSYSGVEEELRRALEIDPKNALALKGIRKLAKLRSGSNAEGRK